MPSKSTAKMQDGGTGYLHRFQQIPHRTFKLKGQGDKSIAMLHGKTPYEMNSDCSRNDNTKYSRERFLKAKKVQKELCFLATIVVQTREHTACKQTCLFCNIQVAILSRVLV